MREFLWGTLTMASLVVALFFQRYWTATGERLFAFFSLAFLVLAFNWLGLAVVRPTFETVHLLYLTRLLAFSLIAIGIVDKNRRSL
ncbi:MAG: hypothetical protein JSR36_10395 [Proteobacteria bacterium]|nr:hypothetical protein [Pseudomonadota bacterium]